MDNAKNALKIAHGGSNSSVLLNNYCEFQLFSVTRFPLEGETLQTDIAKNGVENHQVRRDRWAEARQGCIRGTVGPGGPAFPVSEGWVCDDSVLSCSVKSKSKRKILRLRLKEQPHRGGVL